MKDRSAKYENKRGRMNMVPLEEAQDINALRGLVPAVGARGEVMPKRGSDVNVIRGLVPDPWPRSERPEPQTPHCTAITKKGEPCKAAPIRGEQLCVGHRRSDQAGA